jgi:hypothetical protein
MERRRRIGRTASACLVLLGLVAACGDGGGGRTGTEAGGGSDGVTRRVAVDPDALRPPGSELAPGIEVQPGSSLVGTAFPLLGLSDDGPSGWQAVLVVDGDPVEVWDSYAATFDVAEQASAVDSCIVAREGTPQDAEWQQVPSTDDANRRPVEVARFLTEPRMEGEDRIRCSATLDDVSMAMVVGAPRLGGCLGDAMTGCEPRPSSHLLLRVRTDGGAGQASEGPYLGTDELRYDRSIPASPEDGHDGPPDTASIPAGDPVPPRLDDLGAGLDSHLPAAGEPFDGSLDPYLSRNGPTEVNRVPDGARSLVAPSLLIECNSGLVAVVGVPEGVTDAVALFDEADDIDDDMKVAEGTDDEGRAWAGGTITTAGGYYLDVTAVADGDSSSTVLLTECGD